MRSLKEVLPTNGTSSASDIGVPLDVVDKVLAIITQVIASLKDLVLKVPLLCVILYPVIIILEIIVIYIPGGFPCPIIIGVICKTARLVENAMVDFNVRVPYRASPKAQHGVRRDEHQID
ncbi:hypothetical protein SELMODRAFT_407991 [Selaginella moellendorffii]|uniref:Uncharacterized protein n=1 Tax=Selaginella moellendorffii TaxID=88036 RepID=D8R6V0_SELML|nr:hypothetical protein SELMODRAFT_407991 [Selaginella moellendorffii]